MYDTGMRSLEWAVLWAPRRTYAAAVAQVPQASPTSAVGRVLVAAVILGATMATTTTLVADAVVVARASLTWSFAIAVQIVAALVLVASGPDRRVTSLRAFDLLWATSGPWTLWLAGFTWWVASQAPRALELHGVIPSLVMPAAWTTCLVFAYCREVLNLPTREAMVRTACHQAALWAVGTGYFFWAVQGWPRLIGLFG
jgi:hypothetical protein